MECICCRAIIQTNVYKLVVVDLIETNISWLCGLITNGCLIKKDFPLSDKKTDPNLNDKFNFTELDID